MYIALNIYKKRVKVKPLNYSQLGIRAFYRQNSSLPLSFVVGLLYAFPKWILLLLPPTSPSLPVVQPNRPTLYKLLHVVSFLHNNSLYLHSTSLTPSHKLMSFLCTLWGHKLQLLFLYQTPTKLFRWNLQTQIIFIGECRWSPISLVKVFFTSLTAPFRVLRLMFLKFLLVLSPYQPFISSLEATWSTYFECVTLLFFHECVHLVVDCHTSQCVWHTLKKVLASPSNSRIM